MVVGIGGRIIVICFSGGGGFGIGGLFIFVSFVF